MGYPGDTPGTVNAPAAIVRAILGHTHIHTTLRYARLYDSTVANDYFQAMHAVESSLDLGTGIVQGPPSDGQLLALVDSLQSGALSPHQRETVRALRTSIIALATYAATVV